MLLNKALFVIFGILLVAFQNGCNKQTAVEKLQTRLDTMRTSTEAFRDTLAKVTDVATADEHLDELNAQHLVLAESVTRLDEAMTTSSRATRSLKREVVDYKEDIKRRIKIELDRLRKDEALKEHLEDFLQRMNAG